MKTQRLGSLVAAAGSSVDYMEAAAVVRLKAVSEHDAYREAVEDSMKLTLCLARKLAGSLWAAAGRGDPLLGIVGLNGAGGGMDRVKVGRGHGDGGDGRSVRIGEAAQGGGSERIETLTESRGIARRSHGEGGLHRRVVKTRRAGLQPTRRPGCGASGSARESHKSQLTRVATAHQRRQMQPAYQRLRSWRARLR